MPLLSAKFFHIPSEDDDWRAFVNIKNIRTYIIGYSHADCRH